MRMKKRDDEDEMKNRSCQNMKKNQTSKENREIVGNNPLEGERRKIP